MQHKAFSFQVHELTYYVGGFKGRCQHGPPPPQMGPDSSVLTYKFLGKVAPYGESWIPPLCLQYHFIMMVTVRLCADIKAF